MMNDCKEMNGKKFECPMVPVKVEKPNVVQNTKIDPTKKPDQKSTSNQNIGHAPTKEATNGGESSHNKNNVQTANHRINLSNNQPQRSRFNPGHLTASDNRHYFNHNFYPGYNMWNNRNNYQSGAFAETRTQFGQDFYSTGNKFIDFSDNNF